MKRRWLRFGVILGALSMTAPAAYPISLYYVPGAPTDLGAITRLPWEVLRKDSPGGWSSALALPFPTMLDGVHRMDSGDWLISVSAPADLGPETWLPADIVRVSGASYSAFFCSAGLGLPLGSNVDALFLRGGDAGSLVLGFDAPFTLGGTTYDAADLLEFTKTGPGCASWALAGTFFDASTATPSIPASSNVTGADLRGSLLILSFDVPTTLGATTYMPGDLAAWDGATFSMFLAGAAAGWPVSSVVNDFALLADPGRVPINLTITPGPSFPADITLNWSSSCSAGAENYGIYEGVIGSWYSHAAMDCSDDAVAFVETVVPSAGNRYYLVVPHNVNDEGSYGLNSSAFERPVGSGVCVASQAISPCP